MTRGVAFARVEAEGKRLRHPCDTITEGIGINRLTANFLQAQACTWGRAPGSPARTHAKAGVQPDDHCSMCMLLGHGLQSALTLRVKLMSFVADGVLYREVGGFVTKRSLRHILPGQYLRGAARNAVHLTPVESLSACRAICGHTF